MMTVIGWAVIATFSFIALWLLPYALLTLVAVVVWCWAFALEEVFPRMEPGWAWVRSVTVHWLQSWKTFWGLISGGELGEGWPKGDDRPAPLPAKRPTAVWRPISVDGEKAWEVAVSPQTSWHLVLDYSGSAPYWELRRGYGNRGPFKWRDAVRFVQTELADLGVSLGDSPRDGLWNWWHAPVSEDAARCGKHPSTEAPTVVVGKPDFVQELTTVLKASGVQVENEVPPAANMEYAKPVETKKEE